MGDPVRRLQRASTVPRWMQALLLALVAAFAARQLYRSPYSASELRLVPDSQEYAIVGRRLATLGSYDFELDGKRYPPGTSSWFPLVVAPVYWLAPDELGNAIVPVYAVSIAGVLIAFALGARLAGPLGGVLAALGVVLQRDFFSFARQVMSDAPAVACALGATAVYVAARREPRRLRWHLGAGLLIAAAFAMRSLYLLLLAPFALRWLRTLPRRGAALAALAGPTLAVLIVTWIYQQHTFGHWLRSGFHYWLSVPYDYPSLVFSTEHLAANLAAFTKPSGVLALSLGSVGALLLAWKRPAGARELAEVACLAALPMSAVHLVYYYPDLRFHLFALVLGCIAGAAGITSAVPRGVQQRALILATAVAALALFLPRKESPQPRRRLAAEAIFAGTPSDAAVVTLLDGVYLAALEPQDSRREYVPISRLVEYAAGFVTPRRVPDPDPAPRHALDRRAEGLRAGGAFDVVSFTAAEDVPRIAQWVRDGRPVYLDLTALADAAAVEQLVGGGLELTPVDGWPSLRKLALRAAGPVRP